MRKPKFKKCPFLLQGPPVPFIGQGLMLQHRQRKYLYRVQLQYHKVGQRGVNVEQTGNKYHVNETVTLKPSSLPFIASHLGWISYFLDPYLPLHLQSHFGGSVTS